MFPAQILKRLLARCSQGYCLVVPLTQDLVLQVDADGKSVSFESYNLFDACFYHLQQVRLPDIKSKSAEFFGAFHNGLIVRLYNGLQEKCNIVSGFIHHQICYALA